MPNLWSKKEYVKGFDCESISLKKPVNMLYQMDISESIYEGVVESPYKNLLGQTPTMMVTAGIIEDNSPRHRLTT